MLLRAAAARKDGAMARGLVGEMRAAGASPTDGDYTVALRVGSRRGLTAANPYPYVIPTAAVSYNTYSCHPRWRVQSRLQL